MAQKGKQTEAGRTVEANDSEGNPQGPGEADAGTPGPSLANTVTPEHGVSPNPAGTEPSDRLKDLEADHKRMGAR